MPVRAASYKTEYGLSKIITERSSKFPKISTQVYVTLSIFNLLLNFTQALQKPPWWKSFVSGGSLNFLLVVLFSVWRIFRLVIKEFVTFSPSSSEIPFCVYLHSGKGQHQKAIFAFVCGLKFSGTISSWTLKKFLFGVFRKCFGARYENISQNLNFNVRSLKRF